MGNNDSKLKSEWPELVGKTTFEALRKIKKDRPDIQNIEIIEYNSSRYEYINESLEFSNIDILLKVDKNIVIEIPYVIIRDFDQNIISIDKKYY